MNTPPSVPQVAVINFGSQYSLVIERTLREIGVRSQVLEPKKAFDWLMENPVKAIILSGGAASVYDDDVSLLSPRILGLRDASSGNPIPVLGICYGMQWIAHCLQGKVEPVREKVEYGPATIHVDDGAGLFEGTPADQDVWASHGDSVSALPADFNVIARSGSEGIAGMANGDRTIWGVQFHPEVSDTEHGKAILSNFVHRICGCQNDWESSSIILSIQDKVLAELGEGGKAIFGFSGGVDSTFLSAVLSRVLKKRFLAVTIDGGQLREGELDEIKRHAVHAGVAHLIVDARKDFAGAFADTIEAEEKRRRFKKIYTALLIKAAEDFGATAVIQGTLAPDRIESGKTGGALIKSHHNVGLDMGRFAQLHPIDHLFKYEVRALAEELGLPESVYMREPFPGPGLIIRIVGTPVTPEILDIVRWADDQVRKILAQYQNHETFGELVNSIAQLVVGYIGVNTVGVKGDARAYGSSILVRGFQTTDFMTGHGAHLPEEIEDVICSTLSGHPKIVRVWFDPIDKPPGTTELE